MLVLALVAITGLLGVGSLHEALFGEALASTRVLHQRAGLLADAGVADAMRRLATTLSAADEAREFRPLAAIAESAVVSRRHLGRSTVASGFSIGRFETHYYVIESTARGPRGTSAVLTQGVARVLPVPAPEVTP